MFYFCDLSVYYAISLVLNLKSPCTWPRTIILSFKFVCIIVLVNCMHGCGWRDCMIMIIVSRVVSRSQTLSLTTSREAHPPMQTSSAQVKGLCTCGEGELEMAGQLGKRSRQRSKKYYGAKRQVIRNKRNINNSSSALG